MYKLLNLAQGIRSAIIFGEIVTLFALMISCAGPETTGREQIKYRRDIEVTYVLDRDLLEDPNADFSRLFLVSTLYNPERLPDGRGELYLIDGTLLHEIEENIYHGFMPTSLSVRVFIQTDGLAQKHRATVWIDNYGEIPTGENITIDGAYDIEVKPTEMLYRLK